MSMKHKAAQAANGKGREVRDEKLQACCPSCGYRIARVPRYSCGDGMEIECSRCHSHVGISAYGGSLTICLLDYTDTTKVAQDMAQRAATYNSEIDDIPFD